MLGLQTEQRRMCLQKPLFSSQIHLRLDQSALRLQTVSFMFSFRILTTP